MEFESVIFIMSIKNNYNKEIKMKEDKETNDFVKLAGTVGGIFLVLVIVVIIFAKESLVFLFTNAIWAFVVLGIVLGAFMVKVKNKK